MAQRIMAHFQLPQEEWARLVEFMKNGGAMAECGIDPHLRAVVADLHNNSFFVTRYSNGKRVSQTSLGTRPGEALSDLIFTYVYHLVLRKIQVQLRAEDVLAQIPFDEECSLWSGDSHCSEEMLGPTWADDSAFVASDLCPVRLLRKIEFLATTVINAATAYGLEPNFKKGKTEIMATFRGRKSRAVRAEVYGGGRRSLRIHTNKWSEIEIGLTAQYTHLGCRVERDMTYKGEGARRAAMAGTAFETYRSLVFQQKQIPLQVRGQVFTILVDATLFNLEIWEEENNKAWVKLEAVHARLFRIIFAKDFPPDELLKLPLHRMSQLTGHPPLSLMLKSKRLRYMVSLIAAAPAVLWALIKQQGKWAAEVQEDLRWLRRYEHDWPRFNGGIGLSKIRANSAEQ